ncbi:hypothetical protein AVEN_44845-1 [Araneus ventricosus]|uniref:Uncharacterized protein n=1 Tax=Araneus ventricosus TaxID=182803 RepID=A0A4Y2CK01_ARAVE|nr:hypothetical protein AVEN_44845-1 [Araneus ventricosus]
MNNSSQPKRDEENSLQRQACIFSVENTCSPCDDEDFDQALIILCFEAIDPYPGTRLASGQTPLREDPRLPRPNDCRINLGRRDGELWPSRSTLRPRRVISFCSSRSRSIRLASQPLDKFSRQKVTLFEKPSINRTHLKYLFFQEMIAVVVAMTTFQSFLQQ